MKIIFIAITILVLVPCFSFAELIWEKDEIVYEPKPGDESAFVSFEFTNTSEKAITLTQIISNCPCLEATSVKNLYNPNEKGTIQVDYKLEDKKGLKIKRIYVKTDDENHPFSMLTLIVEVK